VDQAAVISLLLLSASYVLPLDNCSDQSPCYVTAYFDTAGGEGAVRDYACGPHSYDNHRGTDFGVGSFPQMDLGRGVVAAADGMIEQVHDGEEDRCTSGRCPGGGGYGNHVRIAHPDGRLSIYAHLRKDSVRVEVGQAVSCGEVIGEVGSSGYSTGPHLHFEVRNEASRDDPFGGECGGPLSSWVEQGTYRELPSSVCLNAAPPDAGLRPDVAEPNDAGAPDGSALDAAAPPSDAGGPSDPGAGCSCSGGATDGLPLTLGLLAALGAAVRRRPLY
jgi:MYXO-CTERM domain-containing protein